jgi:hypothetical protein
MTGSIDDIIIRTSCTHVRVAGVHVGIYEYQ